MPVPMRFDRDPTRSTPRESAQPIPAFANRSVLTCSDAGELHRASRGFRGETCFAVGGRVESGVSRTSLESVLAPAGEPVALLVFRVHQFTRCSQIRERLGHGARPCCFLAAFSRG